MRKVVKDFDKKPLSLTKQETLDHLKIIIESKDAKKINSDFYRGKYEKEDGTKGNEVIENLSTLYHSKCAYCEDYSIIYPEHYRPKGRVIKTKHGGYFATNGQILFQLAMNVTKLAVEKATNFL